MRARFALLALALAVLAAGCDIFNPTNGAIRVSALTSGGDLDLNGYTVTVDHLAPQAIAVNASVIIADLGSGSHSIELGDLAANCTVGGQNPRSLNVKGGDTAQITFTVGCVVTGVQVTVATSGADLDVDGYTVSVDGAPSLAAPLNGSVSVTRLLAGSHEVTLSGVATNCGVAAPNPRPISMTTGEIVAVVFAVTCRAVTGMVEVRTLSSGVDGDADGYSVQVDGGSPQAIGPNATVRFPGLDAGNHSVTLAAMAVNCSAAGDNPRSIPVTTGGTTRDTARTTFLVTCLAVTGNIEVTAATSGIDVDPNGYAVQIDGGPPQLLGVNGTIRFEGLGAGDHSVAFSGAAANCTVAATNPRTVPVTTGGTTRDTARTTFQVTCGAVTGVVEVTTATSGIDLDQNGYTILVDGGSLLVLPAAGTVAIPGLAGGDHSLRLAGAAGNCTIAGANPRTLHVTTGGTTRDTARTTFQVSCVAVTGAVQVTSVTSGVDPDPNGYIVLLDDGQQRSLAASGTAVIDGVGPGDRFVMLAAVAGNCAVVGQNPQTVTVTTGGVTRDTARATFQITCAHVEKIAYESGGAIALVYADGSNAVTLASGGAPRWSPNGAKLAFVALGCDYYYYYSYYCYPVGVGVMNGDGSGAVQLTFDGSDAWPAWSPDGARIAFTSQRGGPRQLWVMNQDGSNPTAIPNTPPAAERPVWSPDGTQLAFTCEMVSGNRDICLVNANGTGLVRLTTHPDPDVGPAWKPDGSRIAFATTRYSGAYELALMDPNGANVTRLSPGNVALDPTWSSDGGKLAFVEFVCGASGCSSNGLMVINADGTGLTRVTTGQDYFPAWRP